MILLNDFKRQWAEIQTEVLSCVSEVGQSGWYILGREVESFERSLADYWGMEQCVGVANGLDAIEIGLRAFGLQPGDKVLTTPLSAFATTLAILRAGGQPVYVDVDEFGLISLSAVADLLRKSPEIRFLVPVHLFGHSLDLNLLAQIKREFSLVMIEDCAQSIGAAYGTVKTGQVGDLAATSFYPTKNLGALGDGGAILSKSGLKVDLCRTLRDYGQTSKYQHTHLGLNSRLDELQAAILNRSILKRLPEWTERRRKVATRYLNEIRHPAVRCMGSPPLSNSSWHLFPVTVSAAERAKLQDHLKNRGIQSGIHYPTLIVDQVAMKSGVPSFNGEQEFPVARRLVTEELSLPIHPYLSDEEVDKVIDSINSWKP